MPIFSTANRRTTGKWIRWIVLPVLLGGATMALIAKTETKAWDLSVDVSFTNLADNLLVVGAPRPSVPLRVSTAPSMLEEAALTGASCRLDLSGLGEGTHTLVIQPNDLNLPKGVSLMEPVASTLVIRLEKKTSKTVDVLAELEGASAPGFAVAAVRLKPDRIQLTGTAAMLENLVTVRTHPINLEGASESFKKEVPLVLPETVAVDPPSRIVVAEVDIRSRLITRRLEDVPIAADGMTTGYRIEPKGITLTIKGPEAIVDRIETNPDFSVSISLEDLTPGTHSLKAAIKLPLHTTLVQATPELFSVTISD